MSTERFVRLRSFVLVLLLILPGCLGESDEESSSGSGSVDSLEVWYTFAAETLEEEIFLESVDSFMEETGIYGVMKLHQQMQLFVQFLIILL